MAERLATADRRDVRLQVALPAATSTLSVSVCDSVRLLVIRHLAGAAGTVDEALAARQLAALPAPGACLGSDPWQVWIGPTESWLLTTDGTRADQVLAALRPGCSDLACAVDRSAGSLVFDVRGEGVDALMSRLLDACAVPRHAGQGGQTRFIDISAVVLRVGPDRLLLAIDRSHACYAADWIGHAAEATAAAQAAGTTGTVDVAAG